MSYVEHCNQHGQYHGEYCGECVEATQVELESYRTQLANTQAKLQELVQLLSPYDQGGGPNLWQHELMMKDVLKVENARLREALERILGMHSHSPRCFLGHNGWECCFDMHYEQIAREALKGN
jgi:hypothetical protein